LLCGTSGLQNVQMQLQSTVHLSKCNCNCIHLHEKNSVLCNFSLGCYANVVLKRVQCAQPACRVPSGLKAASIQLLRNQRLCRRWAALMFCARPQQKFESGVRCSRSRAHLTASSAWAMLYPVVQAAAKQQCTAEQREHDKVRMDVGL
jgi:hypothetical protein